MKNLIQLAVLAIAVSGLVACSSAKKDDDSILADLEPATESTIESTDIDSSDLLSDFEEPAAQDSFADASTPEPATEAPSYYYDDEDDTSLGIGSSGLGH